MESLYVCLFSNGHIKVGRSTDPESRIANHADRVACMGVELAQSVAFACVGAAHPCEAELIDLCVEACERRFQSEWFSGLDFETVSGWAKQCADKEHAPVPVSALRTYLDSLGPGGTRQFAKEVGINPMYLYQLAAGINGRQPGPAICVRIEEASGGAVSRIELRDDALLIWPELAPRKKAKA